MVVELSYNCCTCMPLLELLLRPFLTPDVAMVAFKLAVLVFALAPPPPALAYILLLRGFNGGNVVEFISDM